MTALEVFFYVLAALNVLAFGYGLRSMRFRVVVQSTTLRSWARRLPRPSLGAIRLAWNAVFNRVKASWPPTRPRVTAEAAGLDDEMTSWIEEIEKAETPAAPAPESGSEDWWRSWADSGGVLPRAAESGRRDLREGTTS